MKDRYVVIMAGGRGERFWPRSREHLPKHLVPLPNGTTLLELALDNIASWIPLENIFVITNEKQKSIIGDLCPSFPKDQIIAEPMGRDTAAAVALGMELVRQKSPEASFAVLSSDHIIEPKEKFQQTLESAFSIAEESDQLVTIGIKPNHPATGYGYLKLADAISSQDNAYGVEKFVEKPNETLAKEYLESGQYLWNAGIFVWSVKSIQAAFQKHCPEIYSAFERKAVDAILSEAYPTVKKISVDYAIMEKSDNVSVVQAAFNWDDLGSWTSMAKYLSKDAKDNATSGQVFPHDAKNNIAVSDDEHLLVLMGVEDLVVVREKDATLVCKKEDAQRIKEVVGALKEDPKYHKYL